MEGGFWLKVFIFSVKRKARLLAESRGGKLEVRVGI